MLLAEVAVGHPLMKYLYVYCISLKRKKFILMLFVHLPSSLQPPLETYPPTSCVRPTRAWPRASWWRRPRAACRARRHSTPKRSPARGRSGWWKTGESRCPHVTFKDVCRRLKCSENNLLIHSYRDQRGEVIEVTRVWDYFWRENKLTFIAP